MNKKILLAMSACLMLPLGFALSGCGHTHKANLDWQCDATHHWHTCQTESCDEHLDIAEHTFDKKVSTAEYLDQPATNNTKATYFYSCECGAKSATETYELPKTSTQLTLWQDMDKVYDGQPVQYPSFTINSGNLIYTQKYFKQANQPDSAFTTTAPTDAGEYIFRVVHQETPEYASSYAEKEFTIAKAPLVVEINKEYDAKTQFTTALNQTNATGLAQSDTDIEIWIKAESPLPAQNRTIEEFELRGTGIENYTLNAEDLTLNVAKKKVSLSFNVTYWGGTKNQVVLNSTNGGVAGANPLYINFELASKNVGTYTYKKDDTASTLEIIDFGISGGETNNKYDLEEIVVVVEKKHIAGKLFEVDYEADGIYEVQLSPFQNNQIEDDIKINFDARNAAETYYTSGLSVKNYDSGNDFDVIFTGLSGADKDNYWFVVDDSGESNCILKITK